MTSTTYIQKHGDSQLNILKTKLIEDTFFHNIQSDSRGVVNISGCDSIDIQHRGSVHFGNVLSERALVRIRIQKKISQIFLPVYGTGAHPA